MDQGSNVTVSGALKGRVSWEKFRPEWNCLSIYNSKAKTNWRSEGSSYACPVALDTLVTG